MAPIHDVDRAAGRIGGALLIRVVVTGSECTGKSTLAAGLARHYGTVWVPEYARQFVLEKGAPPERDDVDRIARGQIELENRLALAVPEDGSLLVQDTDLLSTVVYSRHYYGDCPDWIESRLDERGADLYLLASTDVPWMPDGDLRDRGDRRDEMHTLFRRGLFDRHLPFFEIAGSEKERLREAVARIDALLDASRNGDASAPFRPSR